MFISTVCLSDRLRGWWIYADPSLIDRGFAVYTITSMHVVSLSRLLRCIMSYYTLYMTHNIENEMEPLREYLVFSSPPWTSALRQPL